MDSQQRETYGQDHIAPKEFYEKPKVTTFGSVAKLTMSGGSSYEADSFHTRTHAPDHHHHRGF
jgi:hypothetical protein